MKTPLDFGVDPFGGRDGNGIYLPFHITYFDAEEFIEECRTKFAEEYYDVAPLPEWDKATQQFLVALEKVSKQEGDDGIVAFFNRFAEYVIAQVENCNKIKELYEKNENIFAYNNYVCEQSGGKLNVKINHPDYKKELIESLPNNWIRYWDNCGSDVQRCGGMFNRKYASATSDNPADWSKRFDNFKNVLIKGFIERVRR